ncbi:MAG: hypothetical protein D3906_07835 [Candidatus Electrothrix sp. AUS1_2]|nr:hypothetical protein [Candidatus Electrothrix sp. AUS1_2]
MLLTEVQTHIRSLPRREKYRLIQFIVQDLAQEEPAAETNTQTSNSKAIDNFLKKWKGSLKGIDPDAVKQAYLQEKYA